MFFARSSAKFKVTRDKNYRFAAEFGVSGLQLQFELTDGYDMMQGQPSNFKVPREEIYPILTQIWRFRNVNPVWIVPFHKDVSPSGEQLRHRKLAHELQQPTVNCMTIFHKYCCYTKRVGIITNLTLRNRWWYITDVPKYHTAGKWSMD